MSRNGKRNALAATIAAVGVCAMLALTAGAVGLWLGLMVAVARKIAGLS
jgi:hypothetical protein